MKAFLVDDEPIAIDRLRVLIQEHGRVEGMPAEIQDALGDVAPLRQIYLHPAVTDEYQIEFGEPDPDAVVHFLCEERQFSRDRVTDALARAFPPPRLF